jgi:hypothetical protein
MIAKYAALPPHAAAAFVEMLERRRRDATWAAVTAAVWRMAEDNTVRSILHRQAQAMEAIQASFKPVVLLPDFSGDDFSQLESGVLGLLPRTAEEVENVERIVVQTGSDPENRKIMTRLADHLPDRSEIARMTTWTSFLIVASYLIKMAPEIDTNRIAMLAVIVAVWAVLVERPRS